MGSRGTLVAGGHNDFVVWSDEKTNSDLGSQVDGKLKNDPLLVFALRDAGVTGHSKKPVVPVWKRVDLDGRPTQITWGVDRAVAWDARDRRELSEAEFAGRKMTANLTLDNHVVRRFLGKIALGAGYFVYGDPFREAIDCQPLRELATLDLDTARASECLKATDVMICDRFHPDSYAGGNAHMYRVLIEAYGRSIVICVPHDDAISFHVGLVGTYIGSIICPAITTDLPSDGDHDLGHVICLAPGPYNRLSFRALAQDFYRSIAETQPPSSTCEVDGRTGQRTKG